MKQKPAKKLHKSSMKLKDGNKMAFIESGKTPNKDENYEKMKKRMNNMDSSNYVLNMPSDIHKKLKIKTAQEGITIKSILLDALNKYLEK